MNVTEIETLRNDDISDYLACIKNVYIQSINTRSHMAATFDAEMNGKLINLQYILQLFETKET